MTEDDTGSAERAGIDRRAALKKAAAAGAVVWTAPIVLSSTASAAVVCTLACAPTEPSNPSGTATPQQCAPGGGTGQQQVNFDITVNPGSSECPCGGDPDFDVAPSTIPVDPQPDAGMSTTTFPVVITVTCLDADGDRVQRVCTGTGSFTYSGNCRSAQPSPVTFSLICGPPVCGVPVPPE